MKTKIIFLILILIDFLEANIQINDKMFHNLERIIDHKNDKSEYDFNNRIILKNVFTTQEEIISYEILNYRAIAKHDSGFFTNHIIIITFKNRIEFYDIYQSLIGVLTFDFDISNVYIFKNNDGKVKN